MVVAFAVLGCNERPSAPALRDEPVYDNPNVGLRFQTPTGWTQAARTDRLPPVEREHLLVRFQTTPGQKPALFEVTMQALPESTNVADLVRGPSHSLGPWPDGGLPEKVEIGGVSGDRYRLAQRDTMKESVVVRRGKNLYVFSVVAPKSETRLRDQIRDVLQSVAWTN